MFSTPAPEESGCQLLVSYTPRFYNIRIFLLEVKVIPNEAVSADDNGVRKTFNPIGLVDVILSVRPGTEFGTASLNRDKCGG